MFVALKVFNNNVVLARAERSLDEQVVMGRGVGFGIRPGQHLDAAKIERVYVLDSSASAHQVESFLSAMPYETMLAVTTAVEAAEVVLGRKLARALPIALLDHVAFVIERVERGLMLPPVVMPELVVMYPEEWAAAKVMHDSLAASLGLELPADDAVYLAMHILNATRDEHDQNAGLVFRRAQHIVEITGRFLGITFDEDSLDYARFALHVKFFLQRIAIAKQLHKEDGAFFDFARQNYPRSYQCAKQVEAYVVAETDAVPTDEEMLYLIVHIERLAQAAAEREPS